MILDFAFLVAFVSLDSSTELIAAENENQPAKVEVDIGSRRELFVDHFLIEHLDGAELRINQPHREDIAVKFDKPWEGGFSGYPTVIQDGDIYRLYYRGLPIPGKDGTAAEVTCYAESDDGIHWRKPDLSLFEVDGSKNNNIVLAQLAPFSHNFSPFLDSRPAVPRDQRYKALAGTAESGLVAFASADGLEWRKLSDKPVIVDTGWVFDSQNVAFWSSAEQCYVCYYRRAPEGIRAIARVTSEDFLHWSEPLQMTYSDSKSTKPTEHLYTNQTQPYFRSPHIYIATPKRFFPGKVTIPTDLAAELVEDPAYRRSTSDSVLMTSRGGALYNRTFREGFIDPGPSPRDWIARGNALVCGVVPSRHDPRTMFLYRMSHYAQPTAHLARYTLRVDGFASLYAPFRGGTMVTRPLQFRGAPAREKTPRIDPVIVDAENPIFGRRSLRFQRASFVEFPATSELGKQVTFAAHIRDVPGGHRRLFSAYDGGPTVPRELTIDFDTDGNLGGEGASIRFHYDDTRVVVPTTDVHDFSSEKDPTAIHHLAATWDDGVVRIYLDGREVGRGGAEGGGAISLRLGNLRFGEDYPPTSLTNEPFVGTVDDILVCRRVFSATEIQDLAARGADFSLDGPKLSGVLYTVERPTPYLSDALSVDGLQHARLPVAPGNGEVELELNFASSAAGHILIEIQDATGQPIPGFTLRDCDEIVGDRIDRIVSWRGNSELKGLVGRNVRLKFELKAAQLYSLRFR